MEWNLPSSNELKGSTVLKATDGGAHWKNLGAAGSDAAKRDRCSCGFGVHAPAVPDGAHVCGRRQERSLDVKRFWANPGPTFNVLTTLAVFWGCSRVRQVERKEEFEPVQGEYGGLIQPNTVLQFWPVISAIPKPTRVVDDIRIIKGWPLLV